MGVVVLAGIIKGNTDKLKSPQFKQRYGTALTEGLTLKGLVGTYWVPLMLVRWSLMTAILVLPRDFYLLQILSLFVVSLVYQCLLLSESPYLHKGDTAMALFNEAAVAFYLYALLLNQTDLTSLLVAGTVLTSFTANLAKFLYELISEVKQKCCRQSQTVGIKPSERVVTSEPVKKLFARQPRT